MDEKIEDAIIHFYSGVFQRRNAIFRFFNSIFFHYHTFLFGRSQTRYATLSVTTAFNKFGRLSEMVL